MREGMITCSCGHLFMFETTHEEISCIKCKKIHDVSHFPIKEEPPEEGDEGEA